MHQCENRALVAEMAGVFLTFGDEESAEAGLGALGKDGEGFENDRGGTVSRARKNVGEGEEIADGAGILHGDEDEIGIENGADFGILLKKIGFADGGVEIVVAEGDGADGVDALQLGFEI